MTMLPGMKIRVLVSSRDTGGQYTVCEIETDGSAQCLPHRHRYEDVWLHVLEGEFEFEIERETRSSIKGDSLFLKRGTGFAFRGAGKMLVVAMPGGLDLFFNDLTAAGITAAGTILDKHGIAPDWDWDHGTLND